MFLHPDTAWKFGCGRYIQKPGALKELDGEIARLGNSAFVVAGENAWKAAKENARDALDRIHTVLRIYTGSCSEETAREYAKEANEQSLQAIVGIGGGKIMDLAKLIGEFANLPVINAPTISATCAAFTPLSVLYTKKGGTRGSWYFDREVACVMADTEILARQPQRYAFAGIADSLAKMIEINHNMGGGSAPIDIIFAQRNAAFLYERLTALAPRLPFALAAGKPDPLVEELTYLTIPATGVVSGAARGQRQSALAHCLYETLRAMYTSETKPYLHGELVGVGLRLQLAFDGQDASALQELMRFLRLPMRLEEIGIPKAEEKLEAIAAEMLRNTLLQDEKNADGKLLRALKTVV